MSDEAKKLKAHCNDCGRETNHLVVAADEESGEEDMVEWSVTHEMLKCQGCDGVTFRKRTWLSEWDDYEYGGPGPFPQIVGRTPGIKDEYFPPAVSRDEPSWADHLDANPRELLSEIYLALHSDSRRLATMGARSLIDMVILDKVGDQRSFVRGLDALESEGFLSPRNREVLEAALDAGHAAIHRGHSPTAKELDQVMDIVESLLQAMFVNEKLAESLRKTTPKRKRKGDHG